MRDTLLGVCTLNSYIIHSSSIVYNSSGSMLPKIYLLFKGNIEESNASCLQLSHPLDRHHQSSEEKKVFQIWAELTTHHSSSYATHLVKVFFHYEMQIVKFSWIYLLHSKSTINNRIGPFVCSISYYYARLKVYYNFSW